jgi:hypothetical protein
MACGSAIRALMLAARVGSTPSLRSRKVSAPLTRPMEMTASGAMRNAKSQGRSGGGRTDWESASGRNAGGMRVSVARGSFEGGHSRGQSRKRRCPKWARNGPQFSRLFARFDFLVGRKRVSYGFDPSDSPEKALGGGLESKRRLRELENWPNGLPPMRDTKLISA